MITNSDMRDEPRREVSCDADRQAADPEWRAPQAALEKAFIDEFLAKRGYTLRSLDRLPPGDRAPLLRAATAFATLRLAEVEARAHFLDDIG